MEKSWLYLALLSIFNCKISRLLLANVEDISFQNQDGEAKLVTAALFHPISPIFLALLGLTFFNVPPCAIYMRKHSQGPNRPCIQELPQSPLGLRASFATEDRKCFAVKNCPRSFTAESA